MPIDLSCKCGKSYRVSDELAGRAVRCKQCGTKLKVPAPELTPIEPAEPFNPLDQVGVAYGVEGTQVDAQQTEQTLPSTPSNTGPSLIGSWMESMVVDGSTVASSTAGAAVDLGKYFSCHPIGPAFAIVGLIGGVVGGIAVNPSLLIIAGVTIWMLVQEAVTVRAKFRTGDLNPGIILSAKPWRVAVVAEMQTGGRRSGSLRAVWIRDLPMQKMTGGPPAVGMPVAAVCHYQGQSTAEAWSNIDPTIVNLGLSSAEECTRILRRISRSQWKQLERAIAEVPSQKPGLYKLWLGKGKNAYVTGIGKFALAGVVLVPVVLGVIAIAFHMLKRPAAAPAPAPGFDIAGPRIPPQSPSSYERMHPKPERTDNPPKDSPASPVVAAPTPAPVRVPAPLQPVKPVRPATRPVKPALPTPSAADAQRFVVGQTVEILWGSRWYPGKIKSIVDDKYRVGYDGYAEAFGETVEVARLRTK